MVPLKELVTHLRGSALRLDVELAAATRAHAEFAAGEARRMIGHLQPGAGISDPIPVYFPAWDPLAPSTIEDKAGLGFGPPDYEPLLRTGELRESIHGDSVGLTGAVGSTDPKSVFHEFGTVGMPARPVYARAVALTMPLLHLTLGMIGMSALRPPRV